MVVLSLLLLPSAATGSEVAITLDDLPAHGSLRHGRDRLAIIDAVIATLNITGSWVPWAS
jgi:hypothetical protein